MKSLFVSMVAALVLLSSTTVVAEEKKPSRLSNPLINEPIVGSCEFSILGFCVKWKLPEPEVTTTSTQSTR